MFIVNNGVFVRNILRNKHIHGGFGLFNLFQSKALRHDGNKYDRDQKLGHKIERNRWKFEARNFWDETRVYLKIFKTSTLKSKNPKDES